MDYIKLAIKYMGPLISNLSPTIVNRPLTDQEIDKSYKVGWVSSTLILFGSVCCIGWDIKTQTRFSWTITGQNGRSDGI